MALNEFEPTQPSTQIYRSPSDQSHSQLLLSVVGMRSPELLSGSLKSLHEVQDPVATYWFTALSPSPTFPELPQELLLLTRPRTMSVDEINQLFNQWQSAMNAQMKQV